MVENIIMVVPGGAIIMGVERYVVLGCMVLWRAVVGKMVKRNCGKRPDLKGVVGKWGRGGWLGFLVFGMRGWGRSYKVSLEYVM